MSNITNVFFSERINDSFALNEQFALNIIDSLRSFALHDWGATCSEDWQKNEEALFLNEQIVAKYKTCLGDIFIITEAGHDVTTVLFCSDY